MSIGEQIQREINSLPPAQQQRVLDFIHALQRGMTDEDAAIRQVGAALATQILEPEDFAAWEKKR